MRHILGGLRAAALAGFALLAPTLAAAQDVPGVTADTIRIGSFGALTGPGYLYGRLVMNGVEAVFERVNAAGGVHGRRLVLVREDDRCEPGAAIAATRKLIHQEQVFALLGGGCSNVPGKLDALGDAGIRTVFISIDAPDAPTHEANRGLKGVFGRIREANARMRARGMTPIASVAMTRLVGDYRAWRSR